MGGRALRFLPKCSRSPLVRPALDPQLLNSPGALLPPTATFLGRVPSPLPAFPQRPCLDPGRFLSPGPQPLSVSLLPRTPATPSFPNPQISARAAPGLPGFPRTSCPGSSRVTLPSDQVVTGHLGSPLSLGPQPIPSPQGSIRLIHTRAHTTAISAPDPRSSTSQGTSRPDPLGSGPTYLADANSAAWSGASLPLAQSTRTRRRPRLRPGPGPDRTQPAVQGPLLWPPPPQRRSGVSAPRRHPDLRPALPALTCRWPRPTPAPLPLPRPPVASHQAPPPPP